MERDNFRKIETLLSFDSDDDFYAVELFKRKKDNPTMKKDNKTIKVYELSKESDLAMLEEKIKEICIKENCRAYIRLNRRSRQKVALETLREIAIRIANKDYNIKNVYQSIIGKFHSDPNKKWIIDIDGDTDVNFFELINLYKETCMKGLYWEEIPTNSGIHIICYPFNLDKFKKAFGNIDIHKDNPTLLYCNLKERKE